MESNPYSSPAANLFGDTGSTLTTGQGGVEGSTLHLLGQIKPWARFVGIMLMIVGSLVFLLVIVGLGSILLSGSGGNSFAYRLGYMMAGGAFYGFLAFSYFYPGLKLNAFANRVSTLLREPTVMSLDDALRQQRRLWKFVGIMIIVGICLLLLLVGVGLMVRMRSLG